ncbi:putative transcription factor & chromatin remodeling ARID family [Helianthus annuus]|uniref:Putative ARID DNA-binding domain, HSP20-like chaperone n=1 Tax=Helianthus annuus TaxID=4232 RepID=A0A251S8I2_HELAN|nr:AT-rich interactive domain-containing protein 3 [Helianthus annuus]KAF5764329.1 putative transcription factor & chromatin remodeling ARID family [Helianthus annuus]KAJ0451017.1 putative transcription factor & chromatin remodeling ARID family [Helianthus annuus]KAJ0455388.1 putative transcription factor & chromatin remodeling ARID family [Helianthus annuus]KAJ0472878.1 putative transcription factor & chromatin remodeling ARID family [Helianthus annuus]KAJ0648481.1 putative transcription fact
MLPEDDQEQDKPNSGELNPSSDEIRSNNFTVETTDDANNTEHDHKIGDSVTRSDSVAVVEKQVKLEDDVMDGDVAVVREVGDEVKTLENQKSFLLEPNSAGEDESGTEEEQAEFMKELESFHRERFLEFKPPRFYGEPLNCLKLWRSVIRHGGYEQVTSGKVWRTVGESFNPPKTCTTVSWTFRCFYEKALLEYEKYKMSIGDLPFSDTYPEPASSAKQPSINQTPGSGRARRDAAARAMQGWHSQRLLSNGEVGDPIIKDRTPSTSVRRDKRDIGLLKRKKPSPVERAVKLAHMKALKPQLDSAVVDVGLPADWVKINVQRTKDCFEVYALVPGLLREEVRVQSDPAGRLVISGQPEQLDNPWGVSPFKKVVSLPSRIDPHQTSAVVTLHGQLFVRVPFEQSAL